MNKIKNHYKTIFMSDFHLGTKDSRTDLILDFLKHNICENLYLVGDIIDFWQLKRSVYWPKETNTVIKKLIKLSNKGTKIFYIPGNHDEGLRDFDLNAFGNIKIINEAEYITLKNKRLLIIHADIFDSGFDDSHA